jgi:hypothetical protein
VLAYVPVAAFAMAHHEMWRDELHCWLVARDGTTPWQVVHNRAYDGQPPLWYLLLWLLEKATHDPRSMRVVHLGIAAADVWVFARFAPFARITRALFPFGYFLAYEYAAISRCYGLALLFALLLCVHHRRRFERPFVTALLLGALALTTTVATMVAAGYAAALVVDWMALVRRGDRAAGRAWIPICATVAAGAAAAACAWPPPDSTVAQVRWPSQMPSDDAPTRLIAGLLPIPRVDFFFWNSNALLAFEPFRRIALWVSLLLAAWIVFVLSRDRVAVALFATGSALLVALFAGVYGGDVRHHGFFFVLFVMGAWIVQDLPPTACDTSGWARARRDALTPTFAAVLAIHVPAAGIAIAYDYRYIFSSGQRAADALRARGLADALLVAEVDYPATAVLGQLGPHAWAYSPRSGRKFSFVQWTRDRHWEPTDEQTLAYSAALAASHNEDAILIMNRPLMPKLVDGANVTRIAELYDSMVEEENFYLYRVVRPSRTAQSKTPAF